MPEPSNDKNNLVIPTLDIPIVENIVKKIGNDDNDNLSLKSNKTSNAVGLEIISNRLSDSNKVTPQPSRKNLHSHVNNNVNGNSKNLKSSTDQDNGVAENPSSNRKTNVPTRFTSRGTIHSSAIINLQGNTAQPVDLGNKHHINMFKIIYKKYCDRNNKKLKTEDGNTTNMNSEHIMARRQSNISTFSCRSSKMDDEIGMNMCTSGDGHLINPDTMGSNISEDDESDFGTIVQEKSVEKFDKIAYLKILKFRLSENPKELRKLNPKFVCNRLE